MKNSIRIITSDNTGFCRVGQPFRGEIVILPTKQLEDAIVGYRVFMEVKGKISSRKKKLDEIELATKDRLQKGQEYRFPFEYLNHQATYRGKNVDRLLKIEAFVKKGKRHLLDTSQMKQAIFMDCIPIEKGYKILETSKKLRWENNIFNDRIRFLVFALFFILFFLQTFSSYFLLVALVAAVWILVVGFFSDKERKKLAEEYSITIHIQANKNDDEFEVLFNHQIPSSNIQKLDINYAVIEYVIDNRGTTPTHYRENLYKIKAKNLNYTPEGVLATFSFPDKQVKPQQIAYNANVFWQLNFEVTFNKALIKNHIASRNFDVI